MINRMLQRVFVRVVGFTDAERHALNTVFRLSRDKSLDRTHSYEPWLEGAPEPARLALIDGSAGSAAQELNDLRHSPDVGLIWVGAVSPAYALRTFSRPLRWQDVLSAMDAYFGPQPAASDAIDFDLDSGTLSAELQAAGLTLPASLFEPLQPVPKRALVADLYREGRLYLSSKLANQGITHVDVATSAVQAKAMLEAQYYDFVSIDIGMQDLDPWEVIVMARQRMSVVLVTGNDISIANRLTARMNGCTIMQKPLHPGELSQLLQKV